MATAIPGLFTIADNIEQPCLRQAGLLRAAKDNNFYIIGLKMPTYLAGRK